METEKNNFWKIILILICLTAIGAAWVGFGDRGLVHLYRTEMERQTHLERIRRLAQENQALMEEIHRLRTDMKYVESVARRELNLVRENEVIYRLSNDKTGIDTKSPPPGNPSRATQTGDTKGR
ncbi:MAG: hypothetical protein DRH11_12875 [Deltaproteobacteria bacterium]|nr:MAG: hypothetical protein DRH11_12875 [Deltaproteobacteria bacterium]